MAERSIRVRPERREELDLQRFARAIVALAAELRQRKEVTDKPPAEPASTDEAAA